MGNTTDSGNKKICSKSLGKTKTAASAVCSLFNVLAFLIDFLVMVYYSSFENFPKTQYIIIAVVSFIAPPVVIALVTKKVIIPKNREKYDNEKGADVPKKLPNIIIKLLAPIFAVSPILAIYIYVAEERPATSGCVLGLLIGYLLTLILFCVPNIIFRLMLGDVKKSSGKK